MLINVYGLQVKLIIFSFIFHLMYIRIFCNYFLIQFDLVFSRFILGWKKLKYVLKCLKLYWFYKINLKTDFIFTFTKTSFIKLFFIIWINSHTNFIKMYINQFINKSLKLIWNLRLKISNNQFRTLCFETWINLLIDSWLKTSNSHTSVHIWKSIRFW